jgi:hypothetical protein
MGPRIVVVVVVVEHHLLCASFLQRSCMVAVQRTSATQFGTAAIYEHGNETNQPPRGQEL